MTPRLEDWTIGVREDQDGSWLCITDYSGEGVTFRVDRGSVHAQVLQDLAISLANASGDEAASQRAIDKCIGAHGYDLDRLK
jgi:hypothetical protein